MTEGLKATSKTQVRCENYPFVFSAFCILPQSHLPLRREGRERAAQTALYEISKNISGIRKNNPSVLSGKSPPCVCLYAGNGVLFFFIRQGFSETVHGIGGCNASYYKAADGKQAQLAAVGVEEREHEYCRNSGG